MKNLERRYNHGQQHRGKELEGGWLQQLVAVFNSRAEIWPGFIEEVDPAAFDRTLVEGDPVSLFNHDANLVLGRASAETARFYTEQRGLMVDFDPGDTSVAEDLRKWMKRGDVKGGSIGFYTRDHKVEEQDDGTVIRRLLDVDLVDGGPVVFPAYPQTARSMGLPVDDELLAAAWQAQRDHKPLPREYRSALVSAVESLVVRPKDEEPEEREAEPVEPVEGVEEETAVEGDDEARSEDGEDETPEVDPAVAAAEVRDRLRRARVRLAAGRQE